MTYRLPDLFSQSSSYFNTVPITDKKELAVKEKKALSQEKMILNYFKASPYTGFTPSQVWISFGQCWPKHSVGPRITTLTKKGFLIKTREKRPGYYGDPENVWKWKGESITKHSK